VPNRPFLALNILFLWTQYHLLKITFSAWDALYQHGVTLDVQGKIEHNSNSEELSDDYHYGG